LAYIGKNEKLLATLKNVIQELVPEFSEKNPELYDKIIELIAKDSDEEKINLPDQTLLAEFMSELNGNLPKEMWDGKTEKFVWKQKNQSEFADRLAGIVENQQDFLKNLRKLSSELNSVFMKEEMKNFIYQSLEYVQSSRSNPNVPSGNPDGDNFGSGTFESYVSGKLASYFLNRVKSKFSPEAGLSYRQICEFSIEILEDHLPEEEPAYATFKELKKEIDQIFEEQEIVSNKTAGVFQDVFDSISQSDKMAFYYTFNGLLDEDRVMRIWNETRSLYQSQNQNFASAKLISAEEFQELKLDLQQSGEYEIAEDVFQTFTEFLSRDVKLLKDMKKISGEKITLKPASDLIIDSETKEIFDEISERGVKEKFFISKTVLNYKIQGSGLLDSDNLYKMVDYLTMEDFKDPELQELLDDFEETINKTGQGNQLFTGLLDNLERSQEIGLSQESLRGFLMRTQYLFEFEEENVWNFPASTQYAKILLYLLKKNYSRTNAYRSNVELLQDYIEFDLETHEFEPVLPPDFEKYKRELIFEDYDLSLGADGVKAPFDDYNRNPLYHTIVENVSK
jgi:hypothetical protein